MSQKLTFNTSIIDGSLTNPSVDRSTAKDNNTPYSFLDFITITKIDYTPEEYNNFYITYLKEWAEIKNSILPTERVNYVDSYIQFLKEIVLTYSTNQEKRFLSKLNFETPADLDVAIPFFVEKIRQIIIFYKSRRDDAQFTIERNKIRGNSLSIEKAIYEKIYEYVFAAQDAPSYASLGITLSGLQSNLKINIEEFADVYGNYFEPPPILQDRDQIIDLDTSTQYLNNDPNYIIVDDFDEISKRYDGTRQNIGNLDVFQTSIGIQTGRPVNGAVIADGTIVGVNSTPTQPAIIPSDTTTPVNTFADIPPGTPLPSSDISTTAADLFLQQINEANTVFAAAVDNTLSIPIADTTVTGSSVQDIQSAALAAALSGGVVTDLAGNFVRDNTQTSIPGVFINQPESNVPDPILSNNGNSISDQLNNTNINPVDPKIYFPDATYGEIFGSTAFIEGLPLIANVDLKYDPICDPNNPVDLARRDLEDKTGLTSRQIVDLKRELLSKYMGVDFHFVDTSSGIPVSGVLLKANNPSGNIPNLQTAGTPTVPGLLLAADAIGGDIDMLGIGRLREELAALGELPTDIDNQGIGNLRSDLNALNETTANINAVGIGNLSNEINASESVYNQNPAIIDNRPNRDLSFGDDLISDYGFNNENEIDDRTGTYYTPNASNAPLETLGGITTGTIGGITIETSPGAGSSVTGTAGRAALETDVRDKSLEKSIKLLRNVGLFFKPDKIGLFKLNSNSFTYSIDYSKLEPNKIYYFPDPSVYGNVSVNSQDEYPVVYVHDFRPDTKSVSTGFAQGDPRIAGDEQAFGPYYAKEQSTEKQFIHTDGLNLNFTDLHNKGYISKMQYDVFGNEYALFKDEFGQTFRDREELSSDRIVSKILNGHVFYDDYEGYNFDYSVENIDGSTIRTGISTTTTNTVTPSGTWQFTVSSHPMTFFFREFILYQELENDLRRVVPAFRDGGRFTFLDDFNLPDPLDGDDVDYPDPGNYYYELLAEAGISSITVLNPPRPTNMLVNVEEPEDTPVNTELELDLETDQTDADFTIDVSKFLSAGTVENYDCGFFTDNLILQNDYNYDSNYRYYDIVSENSETKLSQLSATHDYITQGNRDRLKGQLYVKNQAFSLSMPVSSGLSKTFDKYSMSVKGEIYYGTKDIDVIYDTIITETNSYLVFDKINYEDGNFKHPGTKNTVFKIVSSNNLNRFSNRFFHEDKRTVVFAIVSPFKYVDSFTLGATKIVPLLTQGEEPIVYELQTRYRPIYEEDKKEEPFLLEYGSYDENTLVTTQSAYEFYGTEILTLSSGNNKVLMPSIYEYNIKHNTFKKIFPLGTQTQDLSSFFSLEKCFTDLYNFSIVEIKPPKLTYNSLNDVYKLSYIGVDNNNLFHLLDYAFYINNEGRVEFTEGSFYKHDKIVRTSDLQSTGTTFVSAFKLGGDFSISNGKLIL